MTADSVAQLARTLPPLMQLGMMIPLGILMGIEKSREVAIAPNGVRNGFRYVVAAHDWCFGVKFWSFETEEAAFDFFDNGILLRRAIVRRTGPVDYDVLGRAGAAGWADRELFEAINLRIATPRPPLVAHEAFLLA